MKIFARGEKIRLTELQTKLSHINAEWTLNEDFNEVRNLSEFDLILDLNADERNNPLELYQSLKDQCLMVSAVKKSLAQMGAEYAQPIPFTLIGLNALPTFINRELAEVSLFNQNELSKASAFFNQFNWKFRIVSDRVGLVTPRIILMIINEACYTVQEGTASMEDIDISMKLGTNYPFGPFQWADRIGIKNVYETLESIYQDTHDARYKICPLLKNKYLHNEPFYS